MHIDFLIIGQGLAGSLLAWELMQRGGKVVIVDDGKENASQVAAGLINPVTGMRLVKSSEIDTLLPAAQQTYRRLAEFFRQDFYLEKPMLRLFRSDAEYRTARKRLDDLSYQAYLGDMAAAQAKLDYFVAPHGFWEQKQTGYLLTRPLLACLKDFFIAKNSYRNCAFNADDIQFAPVLRWREITATRIIFCEGYRVLQNRWFHRLPLQAVKGEILTLEHPIELPDKLVNYGNWLIPLNKQQSRIGATFDHNNLNTEASAQGKAQLLTALKAVSSGLMPVTVISHQANIRPCTLDKQPFIGMHPKQAQLAVFNGFGAKGSLQIPWYSRCFAETLLNNIPPPADIQRYYATHFPA